MGRRRKRRGEREESRMVEREGEGRREPRMEDGEDGVDARGWRVVFFDGGMYGDIERQGFESVPLL